MLIGSHKLRFSETGRFAKGMAHLLDKPSGTYALDYVPPGIRKDTIVVPTPYKPLSKTPVNKPQKLVKIPHECIAT